MNTIGAESEDFPSGQMLAIASECNLKCIYCYYEQGSSQYSAASLNADDLKLWFEKISGYTRSLTITGGEPLLNPDFETLVRIASTIFPSINLLTNGTRMSTRLAELLSRYGVCVDVSLDHVDRTAEDFVRGGTSKALRGIDRLLDAGASRVTVTMVLTRKNWNQVPEVAQYCRDRDVVAEFSIAGVGAQHPLSLKHLPLSDRRSLAASLLESRDVLREPSLAQLVAAVLSAGVMHRSACAFATSNLFVDADGSVYLCPFQTKVRLGSIHDSVEHLQRERGQAMSDVQPGSCVTLECFSLARGA